MWWMVLLSCAKNGETVSEEVPETETVTEDVANEPETHPDANVLLDGVAVVADWDDGDTFAFIDANSGERVKARLSGFNTLESYGPVHRWGDWTGAELYQLAKQAGVRARDSQWECQQLPGSCGYGRICVACPDLQTTLLREGLAHVFALKDPADPAMLEAQRAAQEDGSGMWEKGVPKELVTSLHSLDEKPDKNQTYNRLISTKTGKSTQLHHSDNYESCRWVCPTDSCMLYVPYKQRYGADRADCLQLEPPAPSQ